MARRMSDDEIEDYTYNKLFGDLDKIQSGSMFDDEGEDRSTQTDPADHAGTPGIAGIDISVKPIMAAAAEGGRDPHGTADGGEDEKKEDKYKGISKLSPLMAQLHKDR